MTRGWSCPKPDARRRLRAIAYASRSLRGAEKNDVNYSMRMETLTLKWALTEKFGDYLVGRTFSVYRDNNILTYLNKKVKLTNKQRWAAYDITLVSVMLMSSKDS